MVGKSLILCEGGDDIGFFNKFCKDLELNMENLIIRKISQDNDSNGKSAFFKEASYKAIKQYIDTGYYSKILFVLDADYIKNDSIYGGFKNTQRELNKIILTLDFKEKAKYFIMCDPSTKNGNLEHLILSTLNEKDSDCILELLDCVLDKEVHSDKKIVLSSYEAIFKESPYNFTHKNFDELRELLKWLNINQ